MSKPPSTTDQGSLEALISQLVRSALQAASQTATVSAPSQPITKSQQPLQPLQSTSEPPRHGVFDQVISLASVASLPKSVHSIQVLPRAVITPAAFDWLRQHGVSITRGALVKVAEIVTANAASLPLTRWILDVDQPERAVAYAKQLLSRGVTVHPTDIGHVASTWQPQTLERGIVVTNFPPLLVDRFARQGMVSAVEVDSVDRVRRVSQSMQPKIWVIDAERLSFSSLVAVAAECLRTVTAARHPEKSLPSFPGGTSP